MAVLHFSSVEELEYQLSGYKWSVRMGEDDVIPDYAERTLKATQLARDSVKCSLDVQFSDYGSKLDIYYPENKAPSDCPVLVYFHGGYWQFDSKDNSGVLAIPLTAAGVIVVGVDYPLCPEVTLTKIIEETRQSVCFVRKQFPTNPLYVSGHSCGGQMIGCLVCTDWNGLGLENPNIKGIISLDGYLDLNVFQYSSYNKAVQVTPKEIEELSPIRTITSLSVPADCKCLLYCGEHSTDEYKRQNKEFIDAIRSRGVECTYREVGGADHFNIVADLSNGDNIVTMEIVSFIIGDPTT